MHLNRDIRQTSVKSIEAIILYEVENGKKANNSVLRDVG